MMKLHYSMANLKAVCTALNMLKMSLDLSLVVTRIQFSMNTCELA